MDYDWQAGNHAQCIQGCPCGGANCGMRKGRMFKVESVYPLPREYLDAYPPGTLMLTFVGIPRPAWTAGHASCFFRKLRPASVDIFSLADASVKPREPVS